MENLNILLAGLPAAGKSTYITALWAVEKDGKSGHLLTCEGFPSETSYIDEMRDNWIELKEVRRTSFAEPMAIELPMKSRRNGKSIKLSIPDFKGEIFQRILVNREATDLNEWCKKSRGILFMTNLGSSSPEIFQEQCSETTTPILDQEKIVMTAHDIAPVIQNILLLKFLHSRMGDRPISICFSSWDKLDYDKDTHVEDWAKENHPCLYNFVVEHFSNYRFYGVSAQGADYTGLDNRSGDELAKKTTEKTRAYIYRESISYDITEPIDYLIQ